MHTQISLKSFTPSFSLVRTVPKRSQLPILEGVLVRAERDQVTLQTTDLERLVSITLPALVFRPGAAVVPVRRLQALLPHRGRATSIGFEARPDHTVQVTLGERTYVLEGENPDDFPDAQPVPPAGWTVDAPTSACAFNRSSTRRHGTGRGRYSTGSTSALRTSLSWRQQMASGWRRRHYRLPL